MRDNIHTDGIQTRFKPGTSGNPSGRPKGSLNRATIVRRWLDSQTDLTNPLTGERERLTIEEMITLAVVKKACEGHTPAYRALMDSAYGTPRQQVEQSEGNITKILIQ